MAVKTSYGVAGEEVAELYGDYLEGGAERCALAVSARPLDTATRNAIEKSLESFGFGTQACSYATLYPADGSVEGGDIELDPQALFLLAEGLDPLFLIACDRASAEQIARAYHSAFDLDVPARVMGRSCAVFSDLPKLLATPEGKQRAWKVLKSLGGR